MEEQIRVLVIEPDDEVNISIIENNMETFQRIVGGYFESVRLPEKGLFLIVNEEGIMNGLPHNRLATKLVKSLSNPYMLNILGTGFITRCDINGDNISLTDEDMIKYFQSFLKLDWKR